MKYFVFIIIFFCISSKLSAQDENSFSKNPDEVLETVFLTGNKLKDFSVGQTLNQVSDSVIKKNNPRLTSLLQYNSPVFFKENGLGMASSPSFRGTTASQTAVLWNGININSNFLGQTDFNTINTNGYDDISLRAGGGSLVYGSGAIGGTIHLNTTPEFKEIFDNDLYLNYGSFNTYDMRYKLKLASEKISFQFNLAHNSSDNNYKYQLRKGKNTNGEYRNWAINTAFGLKLNPKNHLYFYNEIYAGNRNFPVYYLTETPTKYKDFNTRSLLEWNSKFGRFSSNLKTAFWTENYKYFPNKAEDSHTFGKAKNLVGKYDLNFQPHNDVLINAILEHEHINGKGSDVQKEIRDISSVGILFKHQALEKLKYQVGIRQEIANAYGNPTLYSFGVEYEFSSFYTTKLSFSKNFRRPTFNDLYWTNSGNPNLKAEKSHQVELGNQFALKNWKFSLTGYFNNIKDMIHWLPSSGGLFKPYNEDHVQTYGGEFMLNWKKQINQHVFNFNSTYAYTISKNQETKKQLIYVPYHKITFAGVYEFNRFSIDFQWRYNGEVYLNSDNNPNQILSDYMLTNAGIAYDFGKNNSFIVGGRVLNIFNKAYENVRRYEMPGINYNFYINLKF